MSDVLSIWLPIVVLVIMSGLFSGLTLGLLSLDIKQLEIVIQGGTEDERKYANRILPTRRHGNWLLCTLLLGNVAVNALLSILLADMTSGLMGFLLSTALIVIFGEIMPQATCSRYGLAIGYWTVPIVWVIMAALTPIAWPISFILDKALGAEMGQIYTRQMFKSLIKQHADEAAADFQSDESAIMCKVIELTETTVRDIMTPLEKIFCLEIDARLDFETLGLVVEKNHSRIPVFVKDAKETIAGLLFVKDLVLLDPDDEFRVKDILQFYNHLPLYIDLFDDEPMNCSQLLEKFLQGTSHMAICRAIEEDPTGGDNIKRNIGIVTLEDVIAQLLGKHEPEEAPDGDTNPTPRGSEKLGGKRIKTRQQQFIEMFRRQRSRNKLTHSEVSLISRILKDDVPGFDSSFMSPEALAQLLGEGEVEEMAADVDSVLFEKGESTDSMIILLEGHVQIVCGQEDFAMEVGPWTPLGAKSLTIPNYHPDFTAKPRPDVTPIKFLRISKAAYEHRLQHGVGAPPEHLSSRHSSRASINSRSSSRNNSKTALGVPSAKEQEMAGVSLQLEEPSAKPETDDSNLLDDQH